MRCFHFILALTLLFTTPASAAVSPEAKIACYPAKEVISALVINGYAPVADLEIGGLPGIIFSNSASTEYLVFVLKDDVMCEVGSGLAFHLIKRRES